MTKERITKVLKKNLEHQKVAYDSVYSWDTELTEAVAEVIKLLEQNTVSEEVYTEEYKARKQAEYELWKIKEQQSSEDCEYNRGYRDGYDKGNLNGYELRKAEEKKSEDCVSRQAVLDLINADWKYEGLELSVNELPPVTPTHKVGKWEYRQLGSKKYGLVCTSCGYAMQLGYDFTSIEEFKDMVEIKLQDLHITMDKFCCKCGSRNER